MMIIMNAIMLIKRFIIKLDHVHVCFQVAGIKLLDYVLLRAYVSTNTGNINVAYSHFLCCLTVGCEPSSTHMTGVI